MGRLMEAGVTVAAGSDNLQDPFNPVGRADPLEAASLLVVAGHVLPDAAFGAVTSAARALMGRAAVAIEPGAAADLLASKAPTVRAAGAGAPADRVVLRAGRVVARSHLEVDGALPAPA